MAPSYTTQNNVISLPRHYGSSPPPDFAADGSCRTGQTRIRDRWFGIPAVEEKVIYRCGKVRWRPFQPLPRPTSPLCVAIYLGIPATWVGLLVWLWSRL